MSDDDSTITLSLSAWPMPDGTWAGIVEWHGDDGRKHSATAGNADSEAHVVAMMLAFRRGDYTHESLSNARAWEQYDNGEIERMEIGDAENDNAKAVPRSLWLPSPNAPGSTGGDHGAN